MTQNAPQDITLYDLISSFWCAKLSILVGMVVMAIVAVIFFAFVTPTYKAEMIVAPADGYALGDYASSIQYDQIASLPFWRPKDPEGASTDFYRFIYTLDGAAAAEILIKDDGAIEGINRHAKEQIKTPEQLSRYLQRHIKIDPLGATPLRRLSYSHPDAEFSAALLRKLHLVADQMIRRDRRRQSQSRIEYLQNALDKTLNPDHRRGITNLLMQQEHVQMLANLDEAYAAIIVEPASHSPKPTWPNRPLVLGVFILIGAFGGYVVRVARKGF